MANRQAQIDVAFTQWVDAYARDETELAGLYRKRFRPEFQPAVDARIATRSRTNPDAPLSPFAMTQYTLAATEKADDLEAKAAASSVRVGTLIQRADNYSLAVVLFAAALFFAGISTRLRSSVPRVVVLGLGSTLFLGTAIWVATFPVSRPSERPRPARWPRGRRASAQRGRRYRSRQSRLWPPAEDVPAEAAELGLLTELARRRRR